jgi:drug/metabolite transporter (DMT)-like permease
MDTSPNLRARHLLAILYALIGFACWVVGDTFMKLAGTTIVPKYEIMAIGSISGMLMLYVLSFVRHEVHLLKPPRDMRLVFIGIMFCIGYSLYLVALAHLPLANFYVVIFLSPAFLAVLSAFFLHEPLHLRQVLAIIVGFVGVVIAVNPVDLFGTPKAWLGYGAAALGMLCFTIQIINMRILGRTVSREAIAFYPRLGPFIGGLIAMLFLGIEPVPLLVQFYSFAMGAVGAIGWMLVAHAYKLAPVGTIAPFQYCQIIIAGALGYIIWNDVPSLHLLIGGIIIIASGVYVLRHTHQAGLDRGTADIETDSP